MSEIKTVAVAGATGNLGPTITRALIESGFDVTVFSRSGRAPQNVSKDTKVVTVDYSSQDSLVAASRGQDAIVAILPDHLLQKLLIDAAIIAGVKRFIPSEYGANVSGNDKVAGLPVFQGKKAIQDYLKAKDKAISWTVINTGPFLDWGLETGFLLKLKDGPTIFSPQSGPIKIFDGGDRKFSTTLLSDIGKSVITVLRKLKETENRAVYVQSSSVSQNQLLSIATKFKTEGSFETQEIDTTKLEMESYALLQQGEVQSAMINFLWISTFGTNYGCDWSSSNDNKLLGIEELSEAGLERLMKQYC